MATSGTTVFSMTARDIVTTALEDAAVIALGDEPTADEMSACIRRLNMMLKSWAGQGGGLWLNDSITVAVDGGEASVTLPVGVREVTDVRMVESADYQRQLGIWSRADYQSLPNKAASGNPTVFYADRQAGATTLYFWPVPLNDITLSVDVDRVIETVTDASETLDIPEEYQEAVQLNLAVRCAPVFGAGLAEPLQMRAAILERAMLDAGRPASYYMGAACG